MLWIIAIVVFALFIFLAIGGITIATPFLLLAARSIVTDMANRKIIFTFRRSGYAQIISKGNKVVKILHGLPPGYGIDQLTGAVLFPQPATDTGPAVFHQPDPPTWSERTLGAYFYGFPPNKVVSVPVSYRRPLKPGDKEKAEKNPDHYKIDNTRGIVTRTTWVTDLPLQQVISVDVEGIEVPGFITTVDGVETKGQAKIRNWGTATLITHNFLTPYVLLNGNYYFHVHDAIAGAINDFFRKMNLDAIRELEKATSKIGKDGKATPGEFEQAVLNASLGNSGTIQTTGMGVAAYNSAGYDANFALEQALEARTAATLKADAESEEARGKASAITQVGKAEANVLAAKVNALGAHAPQVLVAQERAKGVAGFKGQTLVDGSGASPVIQTPVS